MGWRDFPGFSSQVDYVDKVDYESDKNSLSPLSSLNPLSSKDQAIKNAEDILGARVLSDAEAQVILSKPVGWKGDNFND